MSAQLWEYCYLWLHDMQVHNIVVEKETLFKAAKTVEKHSYDCWITYCSAEGYWTETLTELGKIVEYDPFLKALGILGSIGWELVNVQHGNLVIATISGTYAKSEAAPKWDTLSFYNKVAYFKRQVQTGRAAYEPKFKL